MPLELFFRDNTFNAKADILERQANETNTLFLGSSHMWRAVNPEWFDQSLSMAIGGSAIDIDHLIFNEMIQRLPHLKTIVLEISYHSLEERRGQSWSKNFLIYNYFDINNYPNELVPWQDHLLMTSQPVFYVKKLLFNENKIEKGKFNEYGFIDQAPKVSDDYSSRFASLGYNQAEIDSTSSVILEDLHTESNEINFEKSTSQVIEMAKVCASKNIELLIVSTPKYWTYNANMNLLKDQRRQKFYQLLNEEYDIQILNFERLYERDVNYFINENHLSVTGAKAFTEFLQNKMTNR